MNTFDTTVFHLINHIAGTVPFLDFFMKFFAQYALELYALLFVVAWFTLPKSDEKQRHSLIVAGLAGIAALLINVIISHIWYRSRPFVLLPQGTFTQLIPHSIDASFPSDHSSGSAAFAVGTWGRGPKWIRYTFTTLAIVVMVSRVYCGVHWPTDVLASFAVGLFAGKFMWVLSKWVFPLTKMGLRLFHYGKWAQKESM